jgi:hypothetical protein
MDENPKDEPTQRTPEGAERDRLNLPGEGGTVIPVPTREQVLRDFEKVAKAKPANPSRRRLRRPKEQ